MSGRRQLHGRPFRAAAGAERRHALFVERMGRARTAGQRVSAAASYLTGALARLSPGAAAYLADLAVEQLVGLARRVENEVERESRERRTAVSRGRRVHGRKSR